MNNETVPNEQNETLKSYLQAELEEIEGMLKEFEERLKKQKNGGARSWFKRSDGRIDENEFDSLQDQYNEKSKRLSELGDDDTQLFILRREIDTLREDIKSLGVKKKWQIPIRAWVVIITLPFVIYFVWLAVIQWRGINQGIIYDYPATQTAVAAQTALPSAAAATPISTPAQAP